MSITSLADVDVERLSEKARYALREIAPRMADEADAQRVAEELGTTRREVVDAMALLRDEWLAQREGATLPPLRDEDYEALKDSIQMYGQLYPVLTYRGEVVDGAHRYRACQELGLDARTEEIALQDEEDLRGAAIAANTARRQLTADQRRRIVTAELLYRPTASDRSIAAVAGVSHPTVAKARAQLEERGQLERVTSRQGLDGKERPVAPEPEPVPEAPVEWTDEDVDGLVRDFLEAMRANRWLGIGRWSTGLQVRLDIEDEKLKLRVRKL